MYYVSFEIETPVDYWEVESYRDKMLNVKRAIIDRKTTASKNGSWFYKIYEDISCGAEFVTLPIELGKRLENADVDYAADLVFSMLKEIRKREELTTAEIMDAFPYISTHITFTNSEKRKSPMPPNLVVNSINNIIAFYLPVMFHSARLIAYPKTRSSYFRRYYDKPKYYKSSKSNYPAVFVPDYEYNKLPPFHKIEFRIPDTLFMSTRPKIAELLELYIKLMTTNVSIEQGKLEYYKALNRYLNVALGMKGDIFFLPTTIGSSQSDKVVISHFISEFNKLFGVDEDVNLH